TLTTYLVIDARIREIVLYLNNFIILFFFQAEDGIRDPLVTGVQTCALPILEGATFDREFLKCVIDDHSRAITQFAEQAKTGEARSEERRVGKECRSRGLGYY